MSIAIVILFLIASVLIVAYGKKPITLPRGTQATMSSVAYNDSWHASFGIDGDVSTCARTKENNHQWWQLELTNQLPLRSMGIISQSHSPNRTKGFMVFVTNTSIEGKSSESFLKKQEKCYEHSGESLPADKTLIDFECSSIILGRYLLIYSGKEELLTICELLIYDMCHPGTYSKDTQPPCSECSLGFYQPQYAQNRCLRCPSGYNTSATGAEECDECVLRRYGPTCTLACHCKNGINCDRKNGHCQSGCAYGFTGPTCNSQCISGRYGSNCALMCHCKDKVACNQTTGYCASGCANGFTGLTCSKRQKREACSPGQYGPKCGLECHCKGGVHCNQTTGHCPSGCAKGYFGPSCNTPPSATIPGGGRVAKIVGPTVAAIVVIAIVIAAWYIRHRRKKRGGKTTSGAKGKDVEGGEATSDVNLGSVADFGTEEGCVKTNSRDLDHPSATDIPNQQTSDINIAEKKPKGARKHGNKAGANDVQPQKVDEINSQAEAKPKRNKKNVDETNDNSLAEPKRHKKKMNHTNEPNEHGKAHPKKHREKLDETNEHSQAKARKHRKK